MTLKPLLGTLETIIQNHFKSHMLGLRLISTVSFLKLLEIGMHSLHLLYPLRNILRIASLDSHYWWDLGTSPLTHWPRWMNVCWCVTGKIFWVLFWFTNLKVSFWNMITFNTKAWKHFYLHLIIFRLAKAYHFVFSKAHRYTFDIWGLVT